MFKTYTAFMIRNSVATQKPQYPEVSLHKPITDLINTTFAILILSCIETAHKTSMETSTKFCFQTLKPNSTAVPIIVALHVWKHRKHYRKEDNKCKHYVMAITRSSEHGACLPRLAAVSPRYDTAASARVHVTEPSIRSHLIVTPWWVVCKLLLFLA